MEKFKHELIDFEILKNRAYNMRWAEVEDGVIPLTAADSDFPAAEEIVKAITEYSKSGYFSYTPKLGLPEFRKSLSETFFNRKKEIVNPDLILPIDSAARGMSVIAKAFLKEGDEAIVFDPVDYLFKTSIEAAGAKVILYPMNIVDGKIDFSQLESYITPKTKMLGLCNPHNPLGMLYPIEDLEIILSLSEKYGFYIMNDEIWSDIIYPENKFNSILHLGEERNKKTISVFGFSKSFSVAGLRIGAIYCSDNEVFEKIVEAAEVMSTIGGISSLSQIAGIACCDKGYDWVDNFVAHLTKNRDYALERISKMPGISCRKPQATFVLFPKLEQNSMNSEEFTKYLMDDYKVSIVPGGERYFGQGSEGHVRICLATSFEVLKEGLDRMEMGLKNLFDK